MNLPNKILTIFVFTMQILRSDANFAPDVNSEPDVSICDPGSIYSAGCTMHPSALNCSGRGKCICGLCECDRRIDPSEYISGTFCQCDNFSCARSDDGKICGGYTNGECECGICSCWRGWKGVDCTVPSEH